MLYVERENSGHLPNGEQEGDTSEIMETSIMEGEEYYNQEGGEWTQKVDTGQLCRVCANPNDYLIPIFDGEGLEHELSMKIQKHLPIKVTETDTLPQHMCYQCASTLIAWHDLVISCVEADKKLRELQMEENDDDDDKGGEMFESPSLDSEMTDDVIQPSTSETQNQNQVSKTPSSKKAAVAKEKKSKLKMILVKGPPAGTSGQKTASKTQVAKALELAKSKDGVSQDSASERCELHSLQMPAVRNNAQSSVSSESLVNLVPEMDVKVELLQLEISCFGNINENVLLNSSEDQIDMKVEKVVEAELEVEKSQTHSSQVSTISCNINDKEIDAAENDSKPCFMAYISVKGNSSLPCDTSNKTGELETETVSLNFYRDAKIVSINDILEEHLTEATDISCNKQSGFTGRGNTDICSCSSDVLDHKRKCFTCNICDKKHDSKSSFESFLKTCII
ncbi:uncharacterized protein [Periplaneta americana]|uniref:uncharacterized protein isoform X28 n=1 Tax=Periplaneta americana TaxID=6978 RepID=UPI0037E7D314